MKKKHILLLSTLFFTSIMVAAEDPDETNTKTPNDASKIAPGSQEAEKHHLSTNNGNSRLGRKRRRQSMLERKQIADQQKIALEQR